MAGRSLDDSVSTDAMEPRSNACSGCRTVGEPQYAGVGVDDEEWICTDSDCRASLYTVVADEEG